MHGGSGDLVKQIAGTILDGFNRHFALFREITRAAKTRFENADWDGEETARRERIDYYDLRVRECIGELNARFDLHKLDKKLWQEIKRWYMWSLYEHDQPELAESFYNSVFCKLFDRSYFNNHHIFVKPGSAVDHLDMDEPVYASFCAEGENLHGALRAALLSFDLQLAWRDLEGDVELLARDLQAALPRGMPGAQLQLQVAAPLFYRNKAAYVVGRAVRDVDMRAFVIPLLLGEERTVYADTILTEANDLALIFSFTRAYFMVDTAVPSALVAFLHSILPDKTRAALYAAIGFHKQGKTLFYREFLYHLGHSSDKLTAAPGIRGLVMSVFTLPSYPYVFKVIKDKFGAPKKTARAAVREKYLMVKMHDRVGRMADTMEFSEVAFPLRRFSAELLGELQRDIASSMRIEGGSVIIRHLYIERRMTPLNIFIEHAAPAELESVVTGYGNAVKEMIAANIFPGDMLLKNFGVTRQNRVVFYDYDEICAMNEIRVRKIPRARSPEEEMSAQTWFATGDNDFFPEQFANFAAGDARVREIFLAHHADLLQPEYWRQVQRDIACSKRRDIFPYSQSRRFCRRYPQRAGRAAR